MANLIVTICAAVLLYYLPGFAFLQLADLQPRRKLTQAYLSLALSLVVVPYFFQAVGNIFPFIPNGYSLALLVILLLAAAWLLKRLGLRPVIRLEGDEGQPGWAGILEQAGVSLFILLFALVALLPRLDMFFQGGAAGMVNPWDETWHLAQLTSVARTGIPPQHYLFPSIRLSYYYASWIYPAILGNLPLLQISLSRAMAIQAYVQVFAFLGAVYCFLRFNFKGWWVRLVGLSFFSVMGGFDLYASINNPNNAEWWQKGAKWLVSNNQISQFVTLYAWVPQHLAGGMAFILGLLVWRNLRSSLLVKFMITALLFAFCFTTSPFVFLASAIAAAFYLIYNLKIVFDGLHEHFKQYALICGLFAVIFLLAGWYALLGLTQRSGSIGLNDVRVPLVGFVLGQNPKTAIIDHLLTLIGFPLVAFWIGLIELGLPFLLYVAWLVRKISSGEKIFSEAFDFVLAIFPLTYLFLVFILRDYGGGGDFSMRGMIPAQILILFSGLYLLDKPGWLPHPAWKRLVLAWLFSCFLIAQGVSAYAEVRSDAVDTIKFERANGIGDRPAPKDYPLYYIIWLNQNTPENALILEDGCMSVDDSAAYRWLERSRFIPPACSEKMALFPRDADFIMNKEWHGLYESTSGSGDILAMYEAISFRQKGQVPVYLVSWGKDPKWSSLGSPVFEDTYVNVYRVP